MQELNLIDPRLLPRQHLLSGARVIAVAAIGLTLAAVHYAVERQRLQDAMHAAGMTPQVEETAPPADDGDAAMQARIAQRQALHEMLSKADRLPRDSASTLRAVIQALPETIWLTEVDVVGTQGVRIAGGATDPAALRGFADRLAHVESLRGMPIETLRVEPEGGDDTGEGARRPAHRFVLASAAYQQEDAQR